MTTVALITPAVSALLRPVALAQDGKAEAVFRWPYPHILTPRSLAFEGTSQARRQCVPARPRQCVSIV